MTLTDGNAAYSGGYAVVDGTLRVGDGGLSGALGTGASVAVAAGGTLAFDRDGVVTVDGTVSGNGLIVLDGPGEVYVTSTGTFTGTVLVNNGRLTFAPGATLGNAVIVTNSARLKSRPPAPLPEQSDGYPPATANSWSPAPARWC